MKRWICGVCALVLVLTMSVTPAMAARVQRRNPVCVSRFVDADGDGICDNRTQRETAFADADGDGICDNREDRQMYCRDGRRGQGKQAGRNR